MKKILLFVQAIALTINCYAQTPNWLWAESETNGTCNMDTHGIWASPSGNVYIAGRFGGTLTLNGASASASGTEVFSAKMDSGGLFKWIAPHPYTSENDYDYGMGYDGHENTYVTGQTQGSNGLFVDKYDSTGKMVWSFAPSLLESGMGGYGRIGVDKLGFVYVTGGFGGSENFGPVTLNAVGNTDLFLAKLDSSGKYCKWAISAGANGQNVGGRGVVVDPQGYLYVCGSYNGTTSFNSTSLPPVALPAVSSDAFFIAKYDTSGNIVWVQTASNAGFQSGAFYWQFNSIALDSCSNVYVTGHFINTAQFGPFTLNNANSNYDVFVAKCLSSGTWEWAVSGGGLGNDEGFGIALDKHSDIYVGGYFNGTANFSGTSVTTSAPNSETFVAKYSNSNGALQWIQTGSGTLSNDAVDLNLDNQGHVYIVGDIASGSGAIFGNSNIGGPEGCNIFVAKLDTVAPRAIIPVLQSSYCPGSTDTVPYGIVGTFNSGNVFTVQLSDSNGSFATYTNLGSDSTTDSGKIVITIPPGTPTGHNYLIRVVSSNPTTSSWANGCGSYFVQNVYPNDFYITIGGGVPNITLTPANPTVCAGGPITLKVNAPGNTSYSYLWSNNAIADSINVSPVSDTTYSVLINNGGCSLDTSFNIKVFHAAPLPSQSIAACSGSGVVLTVPVSGSNYSWSPDSTLNKNIGDTVIASPTSLTVYTVTGTDSLGCSVTGYDTVSVIAAPNKPTITISVTGDSLKSSASSNNQWYFDGSPITDSTRQILVIKGHQHGYYKVVVTNPANGCSTTSDSTTSINFISVINKQVAIYPNPFSNNIFIKISASVANVNNWSLQLTDVLGRTLFTQPALNYSNEIDLSNLPGGVYFITINNLTDRTVVPVVKQN